MPIDRKLFSRCITANGAPDWKCPTCSAGYLRLEKDTLKHSWSAESKQASSHEAFGPEWVVSRFILLLKCDNVKCSEVVTVSGSGRVAEYPDERMEHLDYVDEFFPSYVLPSPTLINIPTRTPDKVVAELKEAFVASWGDFSAAGNHVRAATEFVLDDLRIRRTTKTIHGKRSYLSLHSRIDGIRQKYPAVHSSLIAVKWLGNAGSHAGALTRKSVFDALDIFESVLEELYSDHPKALKKLVATVNQRKGPTR